MALEKIDVTAGITKENQIVLLKNELQPWLNTRYVLHKRYAVIDSLPAKVAKEKVAKLKAIEDELVEVEAMISGYEKDIADLEKSING